MNIETLKRILDTLELCNGASTVEGINIYTDEEIGYLRKAIAEAEKQEPVGEVSDHDWSTGLLYRDLEPGTPLYNHPQPKREPLTDEQIRELYDDDDNFSLTCAYVIAFARAIETAHDIKENT
jgi:hypothetical protein